MTSDKALREVLSAYDLGRIRDVKTVPTGLVHATFWVHASGASYIFQRLHPMLASGGSVADFIAVTEHLASRGVPAPKIMRNRLGAATTKVGGFVWRAQHRIPGRTRAVVKDAQSAREIGSWLGKVHQAFSGFSYKFKSQFVLHDTENVLERLEARIPRLERLNTDIGLQGRYVMRELSRAMLPATRKSVIHGDPKVSNFIFDGSNRVRALIDFDTCSNGPLILDIGEGFRSWCGLLEDSGRAQFNLTKFRAAWEGYYEYAAPLLTAEEVTLVPRATQLMILELAARFIIDYADDRYFGWDVTRFRSRREHNLARAHNQIEYYYDVCRKIDALKRHVDRVP